MANRVVSVALRAEVGQFVAGLGQASAATKGFGDTVDRSTTRARSGMDLANKSALLMGGAVVAGLAGAVSKAADFEASMSAVGAATQATSATMDDLRDAAMKAGADTKYSATEAADAITEMGKAGVSAKDIMGGGLTGALALAAAGQIDVADAAGIASTAMTQFNLAGADLPHVADLLAAGAGKAMGSVDDLGQALNQSGLIASAAGLSIEETTGGLAAFASAGLVGSDAGTSFKTMLQALQAPSGKSAELMSELGINMYDANGKMLSLADMAGQLQTHLGGLTEEQRNSALATIFGSDAVRAANVLYTEGAAGIADWTNKVNDAGYAQEQAAAVSDNLKGDIERLGGAFDTFLINVGSGAQGPLREVVQALTGIVDLGGDLIGFFSSIPGPVLVAVGALAGVAALKGPVSSAFDTIALKALYAADSMTGPKSLASAGSSLLGVFGGPWGLAITGATVGLSLLTSWLGKSSDASASAAQYQKDLASALEQSNGAIDDNVRAMVAQTAADTQVGKSNLLAVAKSLGIELPTVTDALLGNKGALEEVTGAANGYIDKSLLAANAGDMGMTRNAENARLFIGALGELAPTMDATVEKNGLVTEATGATGAAMQQTTVLTEEAQKALDDWLESMQKIGASFVEPLSIYTGLLDEKTQAEQTAAQATADATDDASDSWEDYVGDVSVSLDELANKLQEQLDAQDNWRVNIVTIAQRGGVEVAQAIEAMGADGVQLAAQMADGTDAEFQRMADLIVRDAQQGGADAAAALDQQMKVMAVVGAQGGSATAKSVADALGIGMADVAAIASQYGVTLASGINPLLVAVGKGRIPVLNGQRVPDFYDGGFTGEGGKYTPAGIVHKGEFVMPKEAVSRIGVSNLGALAGLPGYASGGYVSAADVPRPSSTAPFGMPISTAGDATMSKEYDEVTAWMAANAGPAAGSGSGMTGTWTSIAGIVQRAIPQARINSTYRPGDPGYHGKNKAVDFGFGSGPGGNGSAGLASIAAFLYGGYGRSLAEIIYDGIGDNTPDVKNGADHVYNAATRAEHRNHVHAAVYHQGTDFVPQTGFAYLEKGEAVIPASVNARSREFSGGFGGSLGGSVSKTDARSYPLTIQAGPGVDQIVRATRDAQRDMEFLHG